MSCLFLLISGPGRWSLDAALLSSDEAEGNCRTDGLRSPSWDTRSRREAEDRRALSG
jgi:hypothetical protein